MMNKQEKRKMAKLEEENAQLKEKLSKHMKFSYEDIRKSVALKMLIDDMSEIISEVKEYVYEGERK